jgi:hypothetical protein
MIKNKILPLQYEKVHSTRVGNYHFDDELQKNYLRYFSIYYFKDLQIVILLDQIFTN